MSDHRVISVGQWLGLSNRIVSMRWTKTYGWIAVDSSGCEYRQRGRRAHEAKTRRAYPNGLKTWDRPTPGSTEAELTPWQGAPQ